MLLAVILEILDNIVFHWLFINNFLHLVNFRISIPSHLFLKAVTSSLRFNLIIKLVSLHRLLTHAYLLLQPHRISVRSVTHNRRTSRDAACTMLIGKNVPLCPTNVRASNVTATSALISWLPSNSNHQHTVCVNNVEVRTVKPGVYRHTITGRVGLKNQWLEDYWPNEVGFNFSTRSN